MTSFFGAIQIAVIATCAALSQNALCADDVGLNELNAAQSAYDHGIEVARTDPEAAQKYFIEAANGFEKVVNGGVTNGQLFYNLGNAQVQSKQIGSGIGSYLQAQRIMPGDSQLQSNLAARTKPNTKHMAAHTKPNTKHSCNLIWRTREVW